MQIGNTTVGGINAGSARVGSTTTPLSVRLREAQQTIIRQRSGFRDVLSQLSSLERGLKGLNQTSRNVRLVRRGDPAASVRGDALGLSTVGARSTLSTTEEINTQTSSYDPGSAVWRGQRLDGRSTARSTMPITITGDYIGDTTETLTFVSRRNANLGGRIQIDIYDGSNARIDRVDWAIGTSTAGATRTSSVTGLTLELGGGGRLRANDTFQINVNADDPQDLDPDVAFNASPGFEGGVSISTGSFQINGNTIAVNEADTLNDVLTRINTAGIDVTATLDGDTVSLSRDTDGDLDIALSNDTSGLLRALKLDAAVITRGSIDERTAAMDQVGAFSTVTAGSFTLNGQTIAVDPTADSLEDVLSRINSSGANVVATLSNDAVQFRAANGEGLEVSGDTSGLLDVLNIEEGTIEVSGPTGIRGSRNAARRISRDVIDLVDDINSILNPDAELDDIIRVDRIGVQSKLRGAIRTAFEDVDLNADDNLLGLQFNLDDETKDALTIRRSDQKRFEEQLRRNPREMRRLLFGSANRDGLVDQMLGAISAAREDLLGRVDEVSSVLSIRA
ncbi:MAG: hypothetical protein AAFV53_28615 [Myxococcota bacterium]